jgi:3-oxoacyl-[acyl-carrier-protein] synthase III
MSERLNEYPNFGLVPHAKTKEHNPECARRHCWRRGRLGLNDDRTKEKAREANRNQISSSTTVERKLLTLPAFHHAEAMSKVINPDDFNTAILFGDGATATIVYGHSSSSCGKILLHRPIISAKPDHDKSLRVANPGSGVVEMQGKKVFGEAVRTMIDTLEQACVKTGKVTLADLHLIVPHQANGRIIDPVRSRFGGSLPDRVVNNIRCRGNTASSSFPVCLGELKGQMAQGQYIGLCTFGGGFAFGAAILEVPERQV